MARPAAKHAVARPAETNGPPKDAARWRGWGWGLGWVGVASCEPQPAGTDEKRRGAREVPSPSLSFSEQRLRVLRTPTCAQFVSEDESATFVAICYDADDDDSVDELMDWRVVPGPCPRLVHVQPRGQTTPRGWKSPPQSALRRLGHSSRRLPSAAAARAPRRLPRREMRRAWRA